MAKKNSLPGTAVKASIKNFGGEQVTALAGFNVEMEVIPDEDLRFNYDKLDADIREEAIAAAVEIRRRDRDASANLMAIGRRLERMKELMRGHFEEWVQTEFDYGTTMARQMMATAKKFGDKPTLSVVFAPSALRLLSTDLVEMDDVEELAEVAQAENRKVTVKEAERVLKEARVRRGAPLVAADRAAAKVAKEEGLRVAKDDHAAFVEVAGSPLGPVLGAGPGPEVEPDRFTAMLQGAATRTLGGYASEGYVAPLRSQVEEENERPSPTNLMMVTVTLELSLRDALVDALEEGKLKSVFNMGQVTRLLEQLGG